MQYRWLRTMKAGSGPQAAIGCNAPRCPQRVNFGRPHLLAIQSVCLPKADILEGNLTGKVRAQAPL